MIAKAKSISHGANGIDYGLEKSQAEIIDKRHVIGNSGKEISQEFKLFQNLNTRTKNNTISMVISPEPKDGRKLSNNDSFISKESQTQADHIAREMNLTRARVVQSTNIAQRKQVRKEIQQDFKAVLRESPKNFKEYENLMKSKGVDIERVINKQGNFQGYNVEKKGIKMKASQVHRSMSFSKMQGQLAQIMKVKIDKSKGYGR